MAAVIGESSNPDFYVRAVTVRWPFLIARPARSNRTTEAPVDADTLSPTGTTPARKLKRNAPISLRAASPVTVRLTLKELAWPRRRIVVKLKSNPVTWNPRAPDPEMTETPPEQST